MINLILLTLLFACSQTKGTLFNKNKWDVYDYYDELGGYYSEEQDPYNYPMGYYDEFKDKNPEIVKAIKEGDVSFIEEYLKEEKSSYNNEIICSVKNDNLPFLEMFIGKGKNDINSSDFWDNTTYLKVAAEEGSINCLEWLIANGADIDYPLSDEKDRNMISDTDKRTALIFAMKEGKRDCFDALLEAGANLDLKIINFSGEWDGDDGVKYTSYNPLMFALQNIKNENFVEENKYFFNRLLEKGANFKNVIQVSHDSLEDTIDCNYKYGFYDQKNGYASVDESSALEMAIKDHKERCFELFPKLLEEVNVKDANNKSALQHAVYASHNDLVRILLEKGANFNDILDWKKIILVELTKIALEFVRNNEEEFKDIIELFKGDFSAIEENIGGSKKMSDILSIEFVAKVFYSENIDRVEGDKISKDDIKEYIKKYIGKKDKSGNTLLHTSALNGHESAIKAFIAVGVDVLAKNNKEEKAIDIARRKKEEYLDGEQNITNQEKYDKYYRIEQMLIEEEGKVNFDIAYGTEKKETKTTVPKDPVVIHLDSQSMKSLMERVKSSAIQNDEEERATR